MNEWYESRHGPCVVCLPHRTQLLILAPAAFEVEADLAATKFARSLRQRGLRLLAAENLGPSHRRTPRCGTTSVSSKR